MEKESYNVAFYTRSIATAYELRNKCMNNNIEMAYLTDFDDLMMYVIGNKKGVVVLDIKNLNHFKLIPNFCQCRNNGEYKFVYFTPDKRNINVSERDIYVYSYDEVSLMISNLPNLIIESNRVFEDNKKAFVSNTITEMLENYKISPKHIGFVYLKDCIEMIAKNKSEMKFLTTNVYSKVAEMNSTTIDNVEKSIRLAIKSASILHPELYGKDTFCDGKITSRKFVAHIVEEVNLP